MSDWIIKVEGLGKKYRIRHQQRERYTALRDVLANKTKGLFRRLSSFNRSAPQDFGVSEDFWALKDVSFEVKQGEVVGIIGRNGAGKSTLLKLLSQITEPTEGRVRLRGRVASLLEVGTGFHPELTGRENIYLNGAILGMTRAEIRRKFDEIVAFAEVEKFLDTPVKRYSSGMYVRLAFAVAAHLEPEILIVDEVLAVGDAQFQHKCLGKMQDVSRSGRTVLFVSHNMAAVQALCGKGVLLNRGHLVTTGSVESVTKQYLLQVSATRGRGTEAITSLGCALGLARVEFAPQTIQSGQSLKLYLRIEPRRAIQLRELAVLLYSEYGTRVGVLDLRRKGLFDVSLSKHPLDLNILLSSVNLVEGDYRLGLYVVTDEYKGDFLDVAAFSIGAATTADGFVPYAADHRGFIDLQFDLNSN